MMAEFMDRMRQLRARLLKGRDDALKARLLTRRKADIKLDGRLDDSFWRDLPVYWLSDLETGARPHFRTSFRAAWADGSLYLGIWCQDRDAASLNIAARKHDDTNIWNGDTVELLLETQTHAYYQIAISPNGSVVDLDRKKGFNTLWTSGVQAATHIADGHWSLEVRVPAAGEGAQVDPLGGVAGRKPSNTYPWYFNICRQRLREKGKELSAFSSTGKPDFHVPMKFARFLVP